MDTFNLTVVSVEELKTALKEVVKTAVKELMNEEAETEKKSKLLKVKDVCSLLGISRVTLHSWKKSGIIPWHRIERKIYFYENEVLEAIKAIKRKKV